MDPAVPPPPRPGAESASAAGPGASGNATSYYPAVELPPSTTTAHTTIVTPETTSTTSQECVLGGVHHSASEEDIVMYGKPVHVHGSLSEHQPTHTPVHHNPHGDINYAKAAKEEMHEMHQHPKGTGPGAVLLPKGKTGVEMWDKVRYILYKENSVLYTK
jgi:hypothetical protein